MTSTRQPHVAGATIRRWITRHSLSGQKVHCRGVVLEDEFSEGLCAWSGSAASLTPIGVPQVRTECGKETLKARMKEWRMVDGLMNERP